jgi:hypothetical protein
MDATDRAATAAVGLGSFHFCRRRGFMKKIALVALLGVMMTATAVHAEQKLLITDVLDQKQVELQGGVEYTHTRGDIGSSVDGSGKLTTNATESSYSLGVGLGRGFEMTASIPYVFSERNKTQFSGAEPEYEKRDGAGDFALEGKYLLLGGEEERYAVVGGLDLKFDTAGNHDAGTGTTDVSPFIAASTNLGHHYTPYAVYRATIRNHEAPDTHTISLGLEKEINPTITLDPKIDANFNTSGRDTEGRDLTANQDFSFELSSYIQLARNFYVIPSVAYVLATDVTDKSEDVHQGTVDGFRGGVSLYYLF